MISVRNTRRLLLPLAFLLLTGVFAVAQKPTAPTPDDRRGCHDRDHHNNCWQAPDGGSTSAYLIGVGAACLGAIFVRSRFTKRQAS